MVLAEKDGQMERDYDYSASVFAEDLKARKNGKSAAKRNPARQGARKPQTGAFLLFMTSEFRALLPGILPGHKWGSHCQRTSFLKTAGKAIAASSVSIIDIRF